MDRDEDKTNRSAAGLRRSAVAERIRLREEWSALKGTTDDKGSADKKGTADEKGTADKKGTAEKKGTADKKGTTDKKGTSYKKGTADEKGTADKKGTAEKKGTADKMGTADKKGTADKNIQVGPHQGTSKGDEEYPQPSLGARKKKIEKPVRPPRVVRLPPCEVLLGMVALVEVGNEERAQPLREALGELGATVVYDWSPLITHLVWAEGGCRTIRANARSLAMRLVSPLWVEACSVSARRLPEGRFPAVTRRSDLPSPRTMRSQLRRVKMERMPFMDLLEEFKDGGKEDGKNDSRDGSEDESSDDSSDNAKYVYVDSGKGKGKGKGKANMSKPNRFRVSNDPGVSSRDSSGAKARVNTAPRRALPNSTTPSGPESSGKKSLRKQAMLNEDSDDSSYDFDDDLRGNTAARRALPSSSDRHCCDSPGKKSRRKLFTQKEADESSEDSDEEDDSSKGDSKLTQNDKKDLTRAERRAKKLVTAPTPTPTRRTQMMSRRSASNAPRIVVTGMSRRERNIVCAAVRALRGRVQVQVSRKTTHVLLGSCRDDDEHLNALSNVRTISNLQKATHNRTLVIPRCDVQKARTTNALVGAARGCRVLYAQWALDSFDARRWVHHCGYEVSHLRKILQKARVERKALGRMRSEYAYDVFNGLRVKMSPSAEQRDAALQLLALCGAVVINDQEEGGLVQDYDLVLGMGEGEVNTRWVFDSVSVGRMRSTRRYITRRVRRATDSPY